MDEALRTLADEPAVHDFRRSDRHAIEKGPQPEIRTSAKCSPVAATAVRVLFIIPPQSYFEVIQKFQYVGSYLEFLRLYYSGYGGFCDNSSCLILPTWNHLWFLPYLWIYTMMACIAIALRSVALAQASGLTERAFCRWGLLLIPMAWIFFLRLTLFERYPSTHALWDDGLNTEFTCRCFSSVQPSLPATHCGIG